MTTLTSIHIVSSSTVVRGKIAKLVIEAGFDAATYASPEEIAQAAPTSGIGLVEGGVGAENFEQVRECLQSAGQWLPIIVFDDSPHVPNVVRVIKQGAVDYIKAPECRDDIRIVVDQVAPAVQVQRERQQFTATAQEVVARLSPRERQVLDYLAAGYSNKMIARALEISPRTVEIHRMKMMAKLGIKSVVEAVRFRMAIESSAA